MQRAFALLLVVVCAAPATARPPPPPGSAAAPAPEAAAPPSAAKRAAVLPFYVEGLQVNDARRLKDGVRAKIAAAGFVLQDEETTNTLVDSSRSLGLDCDIRLAACASTFGRIADVDVVVAG